MDALQFLKAEHRKASGLLQRLRGTTAAVERKTLFDELKRELESDAAVEKEYFYPPLMQREATAALADGGIHDLDHVHDLLMKLDGMAGNDAGWRQSLDQLQRALDEHMRKEEDLLMKGAAAAFTQPQREDLGERMRAHKMRLIEGGVRSRAQERSREERERQEQRPQREQDGGGSEDLAHMAKERSKGFAQEQVRRLAGQVDGLSQAVRDTAENMRRRPEQAALAGYLQRAASGLDRMSEALRDGDVDHLVSRSSELARRQPALFMGGAVIAGFLVTRFFKASESRASSGRGSSFASR